MSEEVPPGYRGVWVRRLLRTPALNDERTWVRWLQTARWHADLRVPEAARAAAGPDSLALQQGFSGLTTVETAGSGEVCTWHRQVDFQPPGLTPDAGHIRFENAERMVETGVHADYLEIWEQLPESAGPTRVLEAASGVRLLITGAFAMRVHPRRAAWPAGTAPGDTLLDLVQRHASLQAELLDFEISFGRWDSGLWHIEHSTFPALEGRAESLRLRRESADEALVVDAAGSARWRVLEWSGDAA